MMYWGNRNTVNNEQNILQCKLCNTRRCGRLRIGKVRRYDSKWFCWPFIVFSRYLYTLLFFCCLEHSLWGLFAILRSNTWFSVRQSPDHHWTTYWKPWVSISYAIYTYPLRGLNIQKLTQPKEKYTLSMMSCLMTNHYNFYTNII